MKSKWTIAGSIVAVLLLALAVGLTQAQGPEPPGEGVQPQGDAGIQALMGTAFTYQGQLKSGGNPVNGNCDFQFSLWDDATGGNQIGSQDKPNVQVSNGLFTVQLDFGAGAFQGDARWLAVAVRCPAGSGTYTTLSPRQALTAAPYALYSRAAPWSGLTGVPAGFADGVDNDTTYSAGTGLRLAGTVFSADTTYLQRRVSGSCTSGNAIREVNADGTVACEPVAGGAGDITAVYAGTGLSGGGESGDVTLSLDTSYTDGFYWKLTGNSGTNPSTHFLGTTDNRALELRVNNARALRLEPNTTSPNLIGGYSGNSVTNDVVGATIGGGGAADHTNLVTDDYGTVSGGEDNWAGNGDANTTNAPYATVGGGYYNTASGAGATIGGGYYNTASNYVATVGGGYHNTASGNNATVGGGGANTASSNYATVGGGYSNTASHTFATVGGGYSNTVSGYAATVGGGYSNTVSGYAATVGGGYENTASDQYATVPGGLRARATHYGEMAYAGGYFAAAGDAQTSLYVMRVQRTCTAGNWFNLYLNGNETPSQFLTIAQGRTVTFDALVVGRSEDGKSAGYHFRGVIENVDGTVAFVGTPWKTVLGEDDTAWDAEAWAGFGALVIQVRGNGENIRWVATVRTAEVSW